jgi:hypothetical protein
MSLVGNSAPRFIRLSTYAMPFSHDLASGCHLPVAVMIRPFAQQPDNEAPVPVVDFGESGPPRCSSCRGYINPWCTWTSAGQKWICNLCQETTEGLFDSKRTCISLDVYKIPSPIGIFCNLGNFWSACGSCIPTRIESWHYRFHCT